MGAAAAGLTFLLIRTERRSAEPVLSPHIFYNRIFVISSVVMGLALMGIFGAFVFLPLFLQLVLGLSPAQRKGVIEAYRHAISTTFLLGAVITALAFTLVLFLPEKPLKSSHAVQR